MYIFKSCRHNAGQNYKIKIAIKRNKNVANNKYFRTTLNI